KNHNLRGMKIYTVASSWGQSLVFVVIGLVIFILPRVQHLSAVTLTGYVLTLLYLMTPMQVIMNMLPTLARANVAIKKVKDLGFELAAEGVDGGLSALTPKKDWR